MKGIPTQMVAFPFAQGIETKVDPKHVPPGKLLLLENGVFDRIGSIQKRNGYTKLSYPPFESGKKIDAAASMFIRNNELYLVAHQVRSDDLVDEDDGWKVFSLDDRADKLHAVGTTLPITIDIRDGFRPERKWIMPDLAVANGYTCYIALEDSTYPIFAPGRVWFVLVDNSTGAKIVSETSLGATDTRSPHVVAVGNSFHVWAARPSSGDAIMAIIDTNDLGNLPGSMTVKRTDLYLYGLFDVCYANHPTYGPCSVIAYMNSSSQTCVAWFDESGVQRALTTSYRPKNVLNVQRVYDHYADEYYIVNGYHRATTGHIVIDIYDEEGGLLVSSRTVTTATYSEIPRNMTCIEDPSFHAGTPADSSMRFFIEVPDAGGWNNYVRTATVNFNSDDRTDGPTFFNAGLASKAFVHGGKARVWMVYDSDVQSTLFLRSFNGAATRTDARVLGWEADGVSAQQGLPQVVSTALNEFQFGALRRGRLSAFGDVIKSVVGVAFDLTAKPGMSVDVGPTTIHTDGGFLAQADGRYAELGFHLHPDPITSTVYATGGNFEDGEYYHKAVYEWSDNAGQLHRSAPSEALQTICSLGGSDQRIVLTIPCLHQGEPEKLKGVKIAVYRLCSDGEYHRCTEGFGTNDNDLTVSSITYSDSDDYPEDPNNPNSIIKREILYTTSNIIENHCPPATDIVLFAKDRVFLVPRDDPEAVWYSKRKEPGEGLAFSQLFIKRISTGGPIRALAELEGLIVAPKEREIRAFSGDGPNDLGQGVWSDDRLITSDVGCINHLSVVRTDQGTTFQSHKGIYLLSRSGQVQYIGAPVETWNDQAIVGAQLVQSKSQVRYMLSSGNCLVFDYLVGQWAIHKPLNAAACCLWKGNFAWISPTGDVYVEGSNYSDGTNPVAMKLETSWIKLAQLQGYQRVRWISLIGEYASDHVLTVEVFYDYDDTVAETITLTADATFGADVPYQMKFKPSRQKCQAIKLRITEADTAPHGNLMLSGLQFEIGVKKGMAKLSARKTL